MLAGQPQGIAPTRHGYRYIKGHPRKQGQAARLNFKLSRLTWVAQKAEQNTTHIVVEKRGKLEDDELELEFRRICSGSNNHHYLYPFELIFADKKSNSSGLQFADLIARPVGLSVLKPEQENRAFDVLRPKFYSNPHANINGWGLKCFP